MHKVGSAPELSLKRWHYLKLHTGIIIYYAGAFGGEAKAIASMLWEFLHNVSRRCYPHQVLRRRDLLLSPHPLPLFPPPSESMLMNMFILSDSIHQIIKKKYFTVFGKLQLHLHTVAT